MKLLPILLFLLPFSGMAGGPPIGGIINDYTEVLNYTPCSNALLVNNASKYKIGDTVLIIQMKGAVIDTSNTASFGKIIDYKNAGNYEYNYVKQVTGNIIQLKNQLTRSYDYATGKVQLVRVPWFINATVTSTLTCLPWDGGKGGVLAFNVRDTLLMQSANIDVSGKGFSGAKAVNTDQALFNCLETQYFYPSTAGDYSAPKGEGIATVSSLKSFGRGPLANAGGGGDSHNSGGGGGSNATAGGPGGNQFEFCVGATNPFVNGGLPGQVLTVSNAANKIFLGGGGGAGHDNNPEGFTADGGNGGGICLITANIMEGSGNNILANGSNGKPCSGLGATGCHEGMGGGGAGGTVLLNINIYVTPLGLSATGGNGADMVVGNNGRLGPGGGGSGGVCWLSTVSIPATLSANLNGGTNGVCTQYANDPWGAGPGQKGPVLYNLQLPVDNTIYQGIDSVKISASPVSCSSLNFSGTGYPGSGNIASWAWDFGDGNNSTGQNAYHNYGSSGNYTIKLVATDLNGCKDSVSIPAIVTALNFDFGYSQDICNPRTVSFYNTGTDISNPWWSLGDGTIVTGNLTPVKMYPSFGNYTVKFSVQNGACTDTVQKIISVNVTRADIIITPDTTICDGSSKQLRTIPSLDFCWSPTTWLSDPHSPNPVTSTPQPIVYYFTASVPGNNLIVNGDFSNGNTGFTSSYNFTTVNSPGNAGAGEYTITTNPQTWNAGMSACRDHTTGSTNMMIVNGAATTGVNVWSTNVTITPNTNYAFSTWIESMNGISPAQLQFSINGKLLSSVFTASATPCQWNQFYTVWNSGTATTAAISLVNQNNAVTGNDFALDDISFAPMVIQQDSVVISIDSPVVKTRTDTTICAKAPVQLNATGAAGYTWSPAAGLSNAAIANPVATPSVSTKYIVTGTTVHGCTSKDSLFITVNPRPVAITSNDTSICHNTSVQLSAQGGGSYTWSPAATLSNPVIANPVASPLQTTAYSVIVTNAAQCSDTAVVTVTVVPLPQFSVSADTSTCFGTPVQLAAAGGDKYTWTPPGYLSNPSAASPIAIPPVGTSSYQVKIFANTCKDSALLSTSVTVLSVPTVTAQKSNDIDCSRPFSQLSASGAGNYTWSPSTGLSDSSIANPIGRPSATTAYIVKGIAADGCPGYDSVTVNVTKIGELIFNIPNAFTPNGDGHNDCFGAGRYSALINSIELSVYNRWGQRVFHSTDPGACWDGTYGGKPQETGGFPYIIRARTLCGEIVRKGIVMLIR